MQPFLSGETTLALLLTLLTLLLFAAAGDEHPYEPSHHNFSARVEKQRSSVELDTRPPVQVEELTIRLDALQHEHQSGESGNVERGESRTEVVKRSIHKAPRNSKPSSYLPSRLRPRNLQILAALLSHQSLYTMINMPVLKSDLSWLLGGLGLPLVRTVRGQSLRSLHCQRKVKIGGNEGVVGQWQRESRGEEPDELQLQGLRNVGGRVVEVGD